MLPGSYCREPVPDCTLTGLNPDWAAIPLKSGVKPIASNAPLNNPIYHLCFSSMLFLQCFQSLSNNRPSGSKTVLQNILHGQQSLSSIWRPSLLEIVSPLLPPNLSLSHISTRLRPLKRLTRNNRLNKLQQSYWKGPYRFE